MRTLILGLILTLSLAGCGTNTPADAPAKLAVSDAVVRLAGVEGRPAAGYFTLHGSEAPDRLVAISSPKAATIELHESSMANGIMTMRALTGVDLPAKGSVAFQPGGNHAMLFGIDPAVKPGDGLALRFTFQSGGTVDVTAQTIGAGDDMPMAGMEHDDK